MLVAWALWQFLGAWGNIDFLLTKWPALKSLLLPTLQAFASIPAIWWQVALLVGGLAWIAWSARRPEPKTHPDVTFPEQQPSRPFFYLDFCWKVQPTFFEVFQTIENPSHRTLDDGILGPLCPGCARSLRRETTGTWVSNYARSVEIENPCPNCGRAYPRPLDRMRFYDLKAEVYKEAQRLARLGQAFPIGPCAQPPAARMPNFAQQVRQFQRRHETFRVVQADGGFKDYTRGEVADLEESQRERLFAIHPELRKWWLSGA